MAKELPYFKFEPAEYLTKDISFCSLGAQGLFINICAYYWQRNCKLTKDQLLKRLNHLKEFDELIDEGVIDLKENGQTIVIKFLDMQLLDVAKTSSQNSVNGAKGGRPKKAKVNPNESENKPTALIPLSETKAIREEKIKEDKITNISFIDKMDLFKKKVGEDDNVIWRDNVYRMHKIQKGKLFKVVEQFTIHLAIQNNGVYNDNFSEFRRHCSNWIGTSIQNGKLSEFRTVKAIGSI
jgi:hypothetical protein